MHNVLFMIKNVDIISLRFWILFLQVQGHEEYRLIFRNPAHCVNAYDCDIYIGIDTNSGDPNFLDIYMEGRTSGWLAVGFSDSISMVQQLC